MNLSLIVAYLYDNQLMLFFTIFAGIPAVIQLHGTDFVTTELFAITLFDSMVTPLFIVTPRAIQT